MLLERLQLLRLRDLLCAGGVALFLVCGVSFCLFLRRLLVCGFRRFITHDLQVKIQDEQSQYGHLDDFTRIDFPVPEGSAETGCQTPESRKLYPTSQPRASRGRTLPHQTRAPPNEIVDLKRFAKSGRKCVAQAPGLTLLRPEFRRN